MIRNAMRRAFIAALSATVLMLGLPSDSPAAPAADANTIVLKDFHFSPMSLAVPAGTTVVWKNLDGEPHTVVSDAGVFRSGGLDQNDNHRKSLRSRQCPFAAIDRRARLSRPARAHSPSSFRCQR